MELAFDIMHSERAQVVARYEIAAIRYRAERIFSFCCHSS